jgi:hypothetical protein
MQTELFDLHRFLIPVRIAPSAETGDERWICACVDFGEKTLGVYDCLEGSGANPTAAHPLYMRTIRVRLAHVPSCNGTSDACVAELEQVDYPRSFGTQASASGLENLEGRIAQGMVQATAAGHGWQLLLHQGKVEGGKAIDSSFYTWLFARELVTHRESEMNFTDQRVERERCWLIIDGTQSLPKVPLTAPRPKTEAASPSPSLANGARAALQVLSPPPLPSLLPPAVPEATNGHAVASAAWTEIDRSSNSYLYQRFNRKTIWFGNVLLRTHVIIYFPVIY